MRDEIRQLILSSGYQAEYDDLALIALKPLNLLWLKLSFATEITEIVARRDVTEQRGPKSEYVLNQ